MRQRMFLCVISILLFGVVYADNQQNGWCLTAQDTTDYTGVCMANGQMGLVVWKEPFAIRQVVLNNIFKRGDRQRVSRIVRGINPLGLTMQINGTTLSAAMFRTWSQQIDLARAVHSTTFSTRDVAVTYRIRALRNLPYAASIEVDIEALRDVACGFDNRHLIPETLCDTVREERAARRAKLALQLQFAAGRYDGVSDQMVATSAFLCGDGVRQLTPSRVEAKLRKGDKASFTLIGSICTTADYVDPWNEAERQVIYAAREGMERVVAAHERLWAALWQSDIVIEGDPQAQLDVRFALFNLYSSICAGSRCSIAPMGLSSQNYNGHIFWDSEIWMFPPLLMLQPEMARAMLDYRVDRLQPARQRAYSLGYRGAMFPWESDVWGEESTPTHALTGPFEHHITADIAIACWNYYCATRDEGWLRREGFPLMREVAMFWCDRVSKNDDGSYSICNVVGADEYASGVTDNAFTNGAARCALQFAAAAASVCGERVDPQWCEIADNLRIPVFQDSGVTREHATYKGEMIKQADANLLGYPLDLITDKAQLLRDLNYYENRIDPKNGPAMSYSVFCIQYARLGLLDKATEMFDRCYRPNRRPPFGVFAETPTSQNPYFMTGAGGLLQAVLCGFGGLQITPDGIRQMPSVLPAHWRSLTLKGVGVDRQTFTVEGRK
ncbi:MAG: glycoside hydrolase family 65 protein [Alistipes sp.]